MYFNSSHDFNIKYMKNNYLNNVLPVKKASISLLINKMKQKHISFDVINDVL